MTTVADAPQDVLLELVKYLEITDLMSFLATCASLRILQVERTLWLEAYARIRATQMHPLPPLDEKSSAAIPLKQLQETVRRANRMIKNISLPQPRLSTVGTMILPKHSRIFCIPGTYLLVSHQTGLVSCWNIRTSRIVASLELPGLEVSSANPCVEALGRVLVGGFIRTDYSVATLVAVNINFTDTANVSISHVLSPDVDQPPKRWSDFFMNSHVFGFFTQSDLVVWSMAADTPVHVQPYRADREDDVQTSSYLALPSALYIASPRRNLIVKRVPLPTNPLPAVDPTIPPAHYAWLTLPSPADLHQEYHPSNLSTPHMVSPSYGVFAVTSRSCFLPASAEGFRIRSARSSSVHFWPTSPLRNSRLSFLPSHAHPVPGSIMRMAVGSSGRYVVMICRRQERPDQLYLALLHLLPTAAESPITEFRELHSPKLGSDGGGEVMTSRLLARITALVLDDSLGLVFMLDGEGTMTVLSLA